MNAFILIACSFIPITIDSKYQPEQVLPAASEDVKLLHRPLFPLNREHSLLKNLQERIKNRRDSK